MDLLFKSLTLSESSELSIDQTCFTTYSGDKKPKQQFKRSEKILEVLFQFMMKRPSENFQAYRCPYCI